MEGQLAVHAESLELLSIGVSEAEQSDQETLLPTLDPETHPEPSHSEEPLVRGQRNKMESVQLLTMSKKNWLNIVLLGFGFMFLFTAFQTSAFVQVCVVPYMNMVLILYCASDDHNQQLSIPKMSRQLN